MSSWQHGRTALHCTISRSCPGDLPCRKGSQHHGADCICSPGAEESFQRGLSRQRPKHGTVATGILPASQASASHRATLPLLADLCPGLRTPAKGFAGCRTASRGDASSVQRHPPLKGKAGGQASPSLLPHQTPSLLGTNSPSPTPLSHVVPGVSPASLRDGCCAESRCLRDCLQRGHFPEPPPVHGLRAEPPGAARNRALPTGARAGASPVQSSPEPLLPEGRGSHGAGVRRSLGLSGVSRGAGDWVGEAELPKSGRRTRREADFVPAPRALSDLRRPCGLAGSPPRAERLFQGGKLINGSGATLTSTSTCLCSASSSSYPTRAHGKRRVLVKLL